MQVKKEKVATLESTQFDNIINRYPSAIQTYKLLKNYFINSEKILDYGSGNGIFLRILQKNKHNAFGWEPSEELVKSVNIFQNINNNYSDISQINNIQFDTIISLRTFAYIPNKEEVIKIWSEKLNKNGILILENGNYNYWNTKYRSKTKAYPGWDINEDLKKEFAKYFELEKKLIGCADYYHGDISDNFIKIIGKKIINSIDRFLGRYFTLFAPHYIYISKDYIKYG
jgi:2-polyprenyl-3-methyl-5-hydroxy-6-metoxy-1,4-benzoquinol methylase